jgi:pimeloyl-ACP methyl ester carboxylesterase
MTLPVTLVLLHGLGANREVWRGVLDLVPDALAPDLPGHGSAPRLTSYTFEAYAEALLADLPDGPLDLLGHSMGGMVALAIAARRSDIRRVVGFGVKVRWTGEDVEGAARQAARLATTFPSREQAAERYLKIAGLTGLVGPDDRTVTAGIVEVADGWQLTQDPATFGFGRPDIAPLLASAPCPVRLARGERDRLVSDEDLTAIVPDPVTLEGLGHNAHVEDPAAVLGLLG